MWKIDENKPAGRMAGDDSNTPLGFAAAKANMANKATIYVYKWGWEEEEEKNILNNDNE